MTRERQWAAPAAQSGGGRVELRLSASSLEPPTANYDARWFADDCEFHGSARIDAAGEAQLEGGGAPAWLLDWTGALLRLIARDHASGSPWPRRLTRWRRAPE